MSEVKVRTTHVGSLPRPPDVSEVVFAKERGEGFEAKTFSEVVAAATKAIVQRQRDVGIDLPSDGEMSKISYATYIKDRLTGFDGDSPRRPPADLKAYPDYLTRLATSGGTPTYRSPRCVGPITVKDLGPLHEDIANMREALERSGYAQGFMNSASPGVIAQFQPSDYYTDHDEYLEAIANAMREEYEAIAASGLILQIDSPDLGLGRHVSFAELDDQDFVKQAGRNVEILNHALRNVPREQVRLHICWGNYEGPHHCDIGLAKVLPVALKVNAGALLFECANPRHAHEWRVWQDTKIPDDYALIPGVIDTTTNFVEHPELVAERISRFVDIVGPERVIAGTDCGFATFAGFGVVDAEIAWAKLASLVEGAAISTRRN